MIASVIVPAALKAGGSASPVMFWSAMGVIAFVVVVVLVAIFKD